MQIFKQFFSSFYDSNVQNNYRPKTTIFFLLLTFLFVGIIYPQANNNRRDCKQPFSALYDESLMPLGTRNTLSGIWTEIRPNVPRVDYWGVYFTNTDTGFACGVNGVIIKTTNGGNNWITLNTGTTKTLRTIGSYDGSLLTAAGDSGIILNSTDLGETWQTVQSGVNKNLWNLQMITENIGWIVGEVSVALKTTNGGQTWINQLTPYTLLSYWDVSFIDSLFGYICCNNGIIIRTTDGGLNWDTKIAGDGYGLFTIKAVTKTKAVALGFAGKHVYTSDGGDSWQFITYLGSSFNKIAFIDTLHGFAVGNTGSFETFDSGLNWNLRWLDMKSANNIAFVNENTGWLVGNNLTIENTNDAGTNWNTNIINDNFKDAFFINANIGWLISDQVYRTSDGCRSLTEQIEFNYLNPSCIVFTDSLTGFIGISGSRILKTTNNGNSWSDAIITGLDDTLGMVNHIIFVDKNIGWATNTRGGILKTIDGGGNWFTQLNAGISIGFNSIHFSDTLNGWTANSNRKPYKTTDGGNNWIEQINLDILNSQDVYFVNKDTGWIIDKTSWGTLKKTTNGGTNWVVVPEILNPFKFNFFPDPKHWMVNGTPQKYLTIDRGVSWVDITSDVISGFNKFCSVTDFLGYAVGNTGVVLQYHDTTYTPVELISFSASIMQLNKVKLQWFTATELNNKGFQIEKSFDNINWKSIGFIEGKGNATEKNNYSFVDDENKIETQFYRLMQIDFDGSFEYSNTISINIPLPNGFKLNQNFPNPFNPKTKIEFQLPISTNVNLTVFNILGEKVKEIVNGRLDAGYYSFLFNGEFQSSGTYIYSLQSDYYNEFRKMILLK